MSEKITRPLLAGKAEDLSKIIYPVYATPKLDGIRCLKVDGKVVTRNFKDLPNKFTREILEKCLPDGVDGEVMLQYGENFNTIQSGIMRQSGEPSFTYHIFDYVKDGLDKSYIRRIADLRRWWYNAGSDLPPWRIYILLPTRLDNEKQLLSYEKGCLKKGYEGVMIRSPYGRYKCGRSTAKEGILLKIKKFFDSEATVLGLVEKMTNTNAKEKDAFGNSKRSSHKAGKVPAGTLGALEVEQNIPGLGLVTFNIGSGFDDKIREKIWNNSDEYIGKSVKYKYQELGKEAPRFPVFLGFRHEDDMS